MPSRKRLDIDEDAKAAFCRDLCWEHFEEASALFEQWLYLYQDPEYTWQDREPFEARMMAHLDGLEASSQFALELAAERLEEPDIGDAYAGGRLFCRVREFERFETILSEKQDIQGELSDAFFYGFCHEDPRLWSSWALQNLDASNALTTITSKLLGYHRIDADEELATLLDIAEESVCGNAIWSLGRLRASNSAPLIYNRQLRSGGEKTRLQSAIALMRMGYPAVVMYCQDRVSSDSCLALAIGLGGGQSAPRTLSDLLLNGTPSNEVITALGLLGDVSAIETLIGTLNDSSLAESTAQSLNMITGAELYEEVSATEEIDVDELFEEELQTANENGEPLNTRTAVTTESKLTTKTGHWESWWRENASRFQEGLRYRLGKPCSPTVLFEIISSGTADAQLRRLANEELVIRYGIDCNLETDMPVNMQERAISSLEENLSAKEQSFKAGAWYYSGQVLNY